MFWQIIHKDIATDIQSHSLHTINYLKAGMFPIPPLYFACIYAFSGFSTDVKVLNEVAIYILAICFFLKYWYSNRLIQSNYIEEKSVATKQELQLITFLVLFAAPLVESFAHERLFLGKMASNVWHNSTSIAVMPFVVLLFHQSIKFIKNSQISTSNIVYILVLSIVNLLIKPSFLFAFVPAFSLILLIKYGIKHKKFWVGLGIATLVFLTIIIEYYLIYEMNIYGKLYNTGSKAEIVIRPFYILALNSQNIPIDIYLSLLFPIICVVFFEKEIKQNTILQYTLWLFAFAFIIGMLLAESGSHASHGNLYWQVILVNYLLFLVFASFAYNRIKMWGFNDYKSLILIVAFTWHVLSGWVYMHHIVTTKSFF